MAEDLGFDDLFPRHLRITTGPVLKVSQVRSGDFAFASVVVLFASGFGLLLKFF